MGADDRKLLDSVVENLPAMVFVKDARELRFVLVNRVAEDILGHSRDEMIGRNDYDFFPAHEADFFTAKDREVLASGRLLEIEEEPIHTRNRGTRVLHTKKIPISGADGQSVYLLGISEDITERKQAERRMAELNDRLQRRTRELEEAVAELEAFSYSVSHDLRAPLRTIDGFAHLLLEDYEALLDTAGRDALSRMREASQRMGNLMDGLLSLAKLTRGDLKREHVDLVPLAEDIRRDICQGSPRKVQWVLPERLEVTGDPDLLRDVLANLLGNAWKFTAKQTSARIELGSCESDGETIYFVRDDGAGFEPAWAGRMFRAFERLHDGADYDGTGVGLASVFRIVRRHGGHVWAEGAPGLGATFYFTLGRAPD
jgi:PAS domain S-box-containing protein